jgi:2-aminoadipate transaminase
MLPDVQLFLRPGIVEFAWGHPDLALLPVAGLADAAVLALRQDGPEALAYGAEQGPGRLIEQLRAHLAGQESLAPPADEIMITGGVSQALDMLCTLLTRPGDPILVQSPVYHLALRIFRDHGLQLVPVAADEHGLRPDALQEALAGLARQGRTAPLLYTVPAFANPTGATLSEERSRALLRLAERAGCLILEDDVYRELWYDLPPPPAIYSLAPAGNVVRLGSFSKILAPGLRLGWLLAAPEIVRRGTGCGMIDSGGGVNHLTAHIVAAFMALGFLDPHVAGLRRAYGARREALLAALESEMPGECHWVAPGGGFFVWLGLPAGLDSAALLPAAEAAGVSYVPGARFCSDGGGQDSLRLAFSLLSPAEMAEGARRLGAVVRAVLR